MPTPVASEIRVRAMRSADLDAVARLHSLAFADYFLTHLGPGFLRRLYAGFLEKPGFPFVALEGDAVVGSVVGVVDTKALLRRFYRANLAFVAGTVFVRVLHDPVVREGVWRRLGEHLGIAISSIRLRSKRQRARDGRGPGLADGGAAREGIAGLTSIAVAPDCRGRGIAESLLAALFETLRQEGVREVRLSVLRENARARRFYERNGWVLTHEDESGCVYSRSIGPSGTVPASREGASVLREDAS